MFPQFQGQFKESLDTNVVSSTCGDNDTPGDIEEFGMTGGSGGLPSSGGDDEDEAPSGGDDETPAPSTGDDEASAPSSEDDEIPAPSSADDDDDDDSSIGDDDDSSIGDDGDDDNSSRGDEEVVVSGNGEDLELDSVVEIRTNANAGGEGRGGCGMVLSVAKLEAEHMLDQDSKTAPDNLFDGNVQTYFAVKQDSTSLTLELDEETEINGISIGFFMKDESEERIQKFSVAVRANVETGYTTVISDRESSGEMGDVQYFEFTSPATAQYIKISSHGNSFNRRVSRYLM